MMDIDATVHMDPPKRRVMFDPTINLGHILTALTMLASGFVAYNNLDKRLTVQEQMAVQVAVTRTEKDAAFKETLVEMKSDVKELRRSIDDLTKTLNGNKK